MKHPKWVEAFHKAHPNAEACPNCGYRYYVYEFGVELAYTGGRCIVCYGTPDFPHKVSEFKENHEE